MIKEMILGTVGGRIKIQSSKLKIKNEKREKMFFSCAFLVYSSG